MIGRFSVADELRLDAMSDDVQRIVVRHVEQQLAAAVDARTRSLQARVTKLETRLAAVTTENVELHRTLLRLAGNFSHHAQAILDEIIASRKRRSVSAARLQLANAGRALREAATPIPDDVSAKIIEEQSACREVA